jgi:hypothetical protein
MRGARAISALLLAALGCSSVPTVEPRAPDVGTLLPAAGRPDALIRSFEYSDLGKTATPPPALVERFRRELAASRAFDRVLMLGVSAPGRDRVDLDVSWQLEADDHPFGTATRVIGVGLSMFLLAPILEFRADRIAELRVTVSRTSRTRTFTQRVVVARRSKFFAFGGGGGDSDTARALTASLRSVLNQIVRAESAGS